MEVIKQSRKSHFKSSLDKNKYMCTANDHQVTNRSLSEIERIYKTSTSFYQNASYDNTF